MALSVLSQGRPDPASLIASQREAMKQFALMDGVWRGPAWTILPSGEKHNITQTERIGPFLDGSIKVIEGRGYNAGWQRWLQPLRHHLLQSGNLGLYASLARAGTAAV